MVLKKASKSERMKVEYEVERARFNHTEYSLKVLEMMYANFRSYNKIIHTLKINSKNLKRTRTVIKNPRNYTPFRVICDVNNALTSQLRDKYRDIDRRGNIQNVFTTSQIGLDNYYSRVC